MHKKSYGFTIVELLIVIVVIAILATISIVAYNGIQYRAKNSQIQTATASYAKSLKLFAVDNSALPTVAQSGGSYVCLGNFSDGICANGSANITRIEFDTLLSQYRGTNARPSLPEEYVYTNNYNNWWRGVWWYADVGQLIFVQYNTSICPAIAGTTFVSMSNGYSNTVICRVKVDI